MKRLARCLARARRRRAAVGKPPRTVPAPPPTRRRARAADPKPETPMPTADADRRPPQPQNLAFPDEDFRAHQPAAGAPRAVQAADRSSRSRSRTGSRSTSSSSTRCRSCRWISTSTAARITDPQGQGRPRERLHVDAHRGHREARQDPVLRGARRRRVERSTRTPPMTRRASGSSSLTKHLDATFALFADTLRTPGLRAVRLRSHDQAPHRGA